MKPPDPWGFGNPKGLTLSVSGAQGQSQGHLWYDPHGSVLTSTLPADLTERLFTGQRFDSSTGLYYYNARYYDPHLGRFIQPDSLVPDPLNPQAWNRFSYCYNNPVTFNDPSGHFIPAVVAVPLLFIASGALVGELAYARHLHVTGQQANATDLLNWMGQGAYWGANAYMVAATIYMAPYLVGYGLSLAGMDLIGASVWFSGMGISAYGLMNAGQSVYNTGYFLQGTGWAGVAGSAGFIEYDSLDEYGRATGARGLITRKMLDTGTPARQSIRPPGFGGVAAGHARGHLIARMLGGSGDVPENLVTLFQNPANSPVMRDFEQQIYNAIVGGEAVFYQVTPIYAGSAPIPIGITLSAGGSGGFQLLVTILNR